jgi:hypothetical protein
MKYSFKKSLMLFLTFLTLIVNAVGVTPAYAATVTVTSAVDPGPGSLREAISAAASGDTIVFDNSLSGQTIHLASPLTINKDLTIDGSALPSQIVISGDTDGNTIGDVRVFIVNATRTVTMKNLTITKGMGNTFVDEPSGFLAEGGGIFNAGILTITNSTLSDNTVSYLVDEKDAGGAISNHGTLTVTNTTFSNNDANYIAGAVYNYIGGTMTIANSTFSANSAGLAGGGLLNRGTLNLINSTFSGNSANTASGAGGGLMNYTEGTLNYANTIIANSTSGGDCFNYFGTLGTNSHNLVEDGGCAASFSGDPVLGALANNTGPTMTMALQAGSPALNAGDNTICAAAPVSNFDQRGQARPQGGTACDIGAFESSLLDTVAPNPPVIAVPTGITNDPTPNINGTAEAYSVVNVAYLDNSSNPVPICTNVAVNGARSWSCTSSVTLPDRLIQLEAKATDAAGNISTNGTQSFTVDTTAPAAPVVTAPVGITNDTTPNIIGTAEALSLVNVWYLNDTATEVAICTNVAVNASGNWSCTSSIALPERVIELRVRATDGVNNTSVAGTHSFTVDATVPAAPVITAPVGFTNDTTPTITGTAQVGTTVDVWYRDNSNNLVPICVDAAVNGSGDWSCTSSVTLPERAIQLEANATDTGGNAGPNALHTFTVDVTAPTVLSIVRADANNTGAASVNFTVTFSETVTGVAAGDFTLVTTGTLTGASIGNVTGNGSTYTAAVNTGTNSGTIRLDVPASAVATDQAGNVLGGLPFTTGQIYNIIKSGQHSIDATGVFRPSNGLLYLKNQNDTGFADYALNYGLPGDYPVVGDWDGNGTTTIGIYRDGHFYLKNSNELGFAEIVFPFGQPGDQPIAGDWDGDGDDTIGVFRPSTAQFQLRNSNDAGPAEMTFFLGNPGDVGIAGDWNGDGLDSTGVFRPSNGIIFLKDTNDTGIANYALNYGLPGDMPVMGDWNGDGIDTIGIYRNGTFYLRDENTNGFATIVFSLGNPGDHPIAGNWDGSIP